MGDKDVLKIGLRKYEIETFINKVRNSGDTLS